MRILQLLTILILLVLPVSAYADVAGSPVKDQGLYILPVTNGDGYQVNSSDGTKSATFSHDGTNAVFDTSSGIFSFVDSLTVGSDDYLGWSDARFYRDAAGVVALRNGTNAQAFRVYNTDDGAGNTERISITWSSNIAFLATQASGSGTHRQLDINASNFRWLVGGTPKWQLDISGNFKPVNDNDVIFGSAAKRPSYGYFYALSIKDGGAQPTCDSGERGTIWIEEGGAGVKDTVEVCAKDAGDAYAWRTIY